MNRKVLSVSKATIPIEVQIVITVITWSSLFGNFFKLLVCVLLISVMCMGLLFHLQVVSNSYFHCYTCKRCSVVYFLQFFFLHIQSHKLLGYINSPMLFYYFCILIVFGYASSSTNNTKYKIRKWRKCWWIRPSVLGNSITFSLSGPCILGY